MHSAIGKILYLNINQKMNKTVLITGASSGIGMETAYEYASKGYDLIIVARRKVKLDEIKIH